MINKNIGYYTTDDETGDFIHVLGLDECLKSIRECFNRQGRLIQRMSEENKRLRDEHFKSHELQKMQQSLDRMKADYHRGFPISKEASQKITEWKKSHDEQVHKLFSSKDRLNAGGAIGGRYSYCFIPTSIGIIGTVKCSCGAEFEFQSL